jgi:glycosyltransferase involved in cell wall biosynthesis
MPQVSVLMVFHRDHEFLRPAIGSLLAQTFRDFELVLVDNGTGLAPEALGALGADPRLRWVRLPRNEGIVGGHNAGIAATRGEFVALMDYDDLSEPKRLEKQVAALQADVGLGLVSARAQRINEHDEAGDAVFCLADPAGYLGYSQYGAPLVTPAAMGRREVFVAMPYRPEFPFAADLDFQSRVAERWRMSTLRDVLLHYRWYPGQTTQQKSALIENSRSAISLATARRRAGHAENLAALVADGRDACPADYSLRVGRQALAEGHAVLAAYRARRAIALDARVAAKALALAAQAWRAAADRRAVRRMFLSGPVRALGLRPA